MATGVDQTVGFGLVALAALIFSYYTIWVIILPFVHQDHFIHSYFLPSVYAVMIPVVAGVVALTGLGVFTAFVLIKSKKKSKPKTS